MHSLKILPLSPPSPRSPAIVVRHIRLWFLATPPAVPILVLQPRIPRRLSVLRCLAPPRSLRVLRCLAAIAVPAPCAPLSWFLCYGWCEKRSAVFCWGSLKPLLLRCC